MRQRGVIRSRKGNGGADAPRVITVILQYFSNEAHVPEEAWACQPDAGNKRCVAKDGFMNWAFNFTRAPAYSKSARPRQPEDLRCN